MAYTMGHAVACANIIKRSAKQPVTIYVFGSCAHYGGGNDVDLLIEVERAVFDEFAGKVAGEGIHPHLKALEDAGDMFWSYFSPTKLRTILALSCIGITERTWGKELDAMVSTDHIDIICLPSGWRNLDSDVRRELEKSVRVHDPLFFTNLEKTAKLAA